MSTLKIQIFNLTVFQFQISDMKAAIIMKEQRSWFFPCALKDISRFS